MTHQNVLMSQSYSRLNTPDMAEALLICPVADQSGLGISRGGWVLLLGQWRKGDETDVKSDADNGRKDATMRRAKG